LSSSCSPNAHSFLVSGHGLRQVEETNLADLETLSLKYNPKITDAGLVNLKGLAGLQELYVSSTKITDAGVADLQKALPNCEISK
jgi:hypothetical protein